MSIRDHIFNEHYQEYKNMFVNGKNVKNITINYIGQSKMKSINNYNHYLAYKVDNPKRNTNINEELKEYCINLSEDIRKMNKHVYYLKINVTTSIKNTIINLVDNKIKENRYHGRIFFEIRIKNKTSFFETIYDEGFTDLSDSLHNKWWTRINRYNILNKFDNINCHLYRKPLKKSNYNIVLSPYAAGQLAHEVFGHIFEADNRKYNHNLINKSFEQIYNKDLTIIDDPSIVGGWGSINYDDSGQSCEKIHIIDKGRITKTIKEGKRVNRLRRQDYRCPLINRVSNTIIGPGTNDKEELLYRCKEGIYIENAGQCYCDPITGQVILPVYEAFRIANGAKVYSLDNFTLYLSYNEVLESIEAIGNDFKLYGLLCSKFGQNLLVGIGAPSLLLKNIKIF